MTTCAEVETLGGQPVIGKRLLPRCSSRNSSNLPRLQVSTCFPRSEIAALIASAPAMEVAASHKKPPRNHRTSPEKPEAPNGSCQYRTV